MCQVRHASLFRARVAQSVVQVTVRLRSLGDQRTLPMPLLIPFGWRCACRRCVEGWGVVDESAAVTNYAAGQCTPTLPSLPESDLLRTLSGLLSGLPLYFIPDVPLPLNSTHPPPLHHRRDASLLQWCSTQPT